MRSNRSRSRGLRTIELSSRRARAYAGAVAAVTVLVLPAAASAKTTLIGSGSSAAQPYMQLLFSTYHRSHPSISFKYNPDGGNQGVKDVQAGVSEFAVQTAPPVAANKGTTFAPLLYDALCVDVNSKNSETSINVPTLRGIYSGAILNWNDSALPSNLSGTIDPQGRNTAAGQYTFFTNSVMGTTPYAGNVSKLSADGLVANAVVKDKYAIGYVGLANSRKKGERALKIAAKSGGTSYSCSAKNVRSRKYPLWRFDYGVTNTKKPNAKVLAFFNWVTDTKAAAKVINKAGAVATPKHRYGAAF